MTKREIILILGGAFNPIHTKHIETICIAKDYLENNYNFKVIEAYLAPATDGYIKHKVKNDLKIKDVHRVNMCNLAIKKYEWFKEIHKCYGSALEAGKHFKGNRDIDIGIVMGADRAINKNGQPKWYREPKFKYLTIIIGRSGDTERVENLYNESYKLKTRETNDSDFMFVKNETIDVSSTKIREQLCLIKNRINSEKISIINELVTNKFMDQDVFEYILENEATLYL